MTVIARCLEVSRSNLYEPFLIQADSTSLSREKLSEREEYRALLIQIREILARRPTYGYRRIAAILRRECSSAVNHKKIYRIMKQANLLLQKFSGKSERTHRGKVITLRSDTRCCTDSFGIQCWNGEQLQVAFSMDCCDREIISWVTSTRGIDGSLVRDLMTDSLEKRFPGARKCPQTVQWLSDNGPGYTARQTVFYSKNFEISNLHNAKL